MSTLNLSKTERIDVRASTPVKQLRGDMGYRFRGDVHQPGRGDTTCNACGQTEISQFYHRPEVPGADGGITIINIGGIAVGRQHALISHKAAHALISHKSGGGRVVKRP